MKKLIFWLNNKHGTIKKSMKAFGNTKEAYQLFGGEVYIETGYPSDTRSIFQKTKEIAENWRKYTN